MLRGSHRQCSVLLRCACPAITVQANECSLPRPPSSSSVHAAHLGAVHDFPFPALTLMSKGNGSPEGSRVKGFISISVASTSRKTCSVAMSWTEHCRASQSQDQLPMSARPQTAPRPLAPHGSKCDLDTTPMKCAAHFSKDALTWQHASGPRSPPAPNSGTPS